MESNSDPRELHLLEHIESDPDVNQATLAAQLGVAVGTANLLIKKLVDKGYVKAKRAQRKKLRYIITPKGIAHRAELTVNYIENSLKLYRRTRQQVKELLLEVRTMGYDSVQVMGDGDIGEICRLTCLEEGIQVANRPELPSLEVRGWKVYLVMGPADE
jgi:DNA-binding MarR family transcriptional regulator